MERNSIREERGSGSLSDGLAGAYGAYERAYTPVLRSQSRATVAPSKAMALFMVPGLDDAITTKRHPWYLLRTPSAVWHVKRPCEGVVCVDPLLILYTHTPVWDSVVNTYRRLTKVTLELPPEPLLSGMREVIMAMVLRRASAGTPADLAAVASTMPDPGVFSAAVKAALEVVNTEVARRIMVRSAGANPAANPVRSMQDVSAMRESVTVQKQKDRHACKVLARSILDEAMRHGLVGSMGEWAVLLGVSQAHLSAYLGRKGGQQGPVGGNVEWSTPILTKIVRWNYEERMGKQIGPGTKTGILLAIMRKLIPRAPELAEFDHIQLPERKA